MINREYYLEIEQEIINDKNWNLFVSDMMRQMLSAYIDNDIAIYGCGKYGIKCLKYFDLAEISVAYVIDKEQKRIKQYETCSPVKLKEISHEILLVVASLQYEDEVGHIIRHILGRPVQIMSFCDLLAEVVKRYIEYKMERRLLSEIEYKSMFFLYGPYSTWNIALESATEYGYEDPVILDKYIETWRLMKNGVLGRKPNTKLLEAFLYAVCREDVLEVLDFGGALGNIYYYYKDIFGKYDLKWNVVEQQHIAEWGDKHISELSFFPTIEQCMEQKGINCCLFSSSLQYLDDPFDYLERCLVYQPKYIIFDRTPVKSIKKDIIMCENVPESIEGKRVAYPIWIFSLNKLEMFMEKYNYKKVMVWETDDCFWTKNDFGMVHFKGALYVQ